jgi:predicted short-subunit dehydrogenase-like oxidoreductase (DUF2520 family)
VPALAVIGRGRAGSSIARAALAAGVATTLAGRDDALEACAASEVALLCVPDGSIADVAATAAQAVPPLRFVGHTSGATSLDALAAPAAAGAATFSLHPLQTLPDGGSDLAGAACAIARSTPAAHELAEALARTLGMTPFTIAEEDRAAYHAAASMASNYLVALEECAAGLLARIGVDDAREVLAPLVLRSAANWAEGGAAALTGPIARGDAETVDRHREAIARVAPELLGLYDELAERTAAVAAVSA